MSPRVLAFSGWSGTGKTEFLTGLIAILAERGWKVAVLKHHGHRAGDLRRKERTLFLPKDTQRYLQAGALAAELITGAWSEDILNAAASRMEAAGADLILAEGFKYSKLPKFCFVKDDIMLEAFLPENCLAWIGDPGREKGNIWFQSDDHEGVANYIEKLMKGEIAWLTSP